MDTNVFIAALLSPAGINRQVVRACLAGRAVPLMGAALFHEYEDLLGREDLMAKCPLSLVERKLLLESFLSVAEWVRVYYLWRPNLPDEGDNHLIELAIAGAAEVLVTHNLRDLDRGQLQFPHLRILDPQTFLSTLP